MIFVAPRKAIHPIADRRLDPHLNQAASRPIVRFTRHHLRNLERQHLFVTEMEMHQPSKPVLPAVVLTIQEIIHCPLPPFQLAPASPCLAQGTLIESNADHPPGSKLTLREVRFSFSPVLPRDSIPVAVLYFALSLRSSTSLPLLITTDTRL